MVLFILEVRIEMENVQSLELPEGYSYCIDVQNSAGEDAREGVYVTSASEEELTGSKGTCNFQVKWVRDARSSAHLTVHESVKDITRRRITGDDNGAWVPILGLDCRGLEPTKFHPENGWKVVSSGGTVYDDVDLREEWAEYCEKAQDSVGIYSVESRFVRTK